MPTNTINAVDKVINPTTYNPSGDANGTRYLLTDDIGDRLTETANKTTEWGKLVAKTNDIIEKVGGEWIVDFHGTFDDSTQLALGLQDSSSARGTVGLDSATQLDSTFTKIHYVTNITTGVQFKWTGEFWIKSYEGFYAPGTWTISF